MPRGNDPTAGRDIAAQYGEGHGNAEDLIRYHDDELDADLNRALLKPVDPAATDALDLESIKPKYGGTIMSAVIRGGRLVVVEDDEGHYRKWHDDVPGGKAKSESKSQGGSKAKGGGKVDSGAQGRKDAAVHSQAENPTGDPDKNDGGTGASGGQSAGSTGAASSPSPSSGMKSGGTGASR